jgi:hypothetical protein
MKLFAGLHPQRGVLAVEQAVSVLRDGLDRLRGRGPYSLCELFPDGDDYDWLQRWAAELTTGTIYQTGWKSGALALMVIAEMARREAQGNQVWTIIRGVFRDEADRKLFSQGQPKPLLKELLVEATAQLDLRHVFDREVGKNWYISIYLQFGIPQKGMLDNLPHWLAGGSTADSIALLRDGALASDSFQTFWSQLRDFRKGWLGEEDMRRAIRSCPWVLSEWEADVVRLARESRGLPDLGPETPSVRQGPFQPTDGEEPPFLQPPRFRWEPPELPAFACSWADPDALGLDAIPFNGA